MGNFRANDRVKRCPGFDRNPRHLRGAIGVVRRAWRDDQGLPRVDIDFPDAPELSVIGDAPSQYMPADRD